jgi:hypothetical protein
MCTVGCNIKSNSFNADCGQKSWKGSTIYFVSSKLGACDIGKSLNFGEL